MVVLSLCLSGLFMFLEFGKLKRFLSWYFALFPLFLLFVMVSFNRMNRDYSTYELAFQDEIYRNTLDFGYVFLVKNLIDLGGNHETIIFLVGSLLVLILLKMLKTSNHVNVVLFFYSLFPLIFDINQVRNFLMYLLMILSLYYVEKNKPIRHYVILFVAFSVHKFALIYLPFFYFCKLNRKKFLLLMLCGSIALIISTPVFLSIAQSLYPLKMKFYLIKQTGYVVASYVICQVIDVFTVWWVDRRIAPRLKDEDKRKMEVLYRFVWYPVLLVPFIFYTVEVSRMQRNALLVKYIYSALAMKYMSFREKLVTVLMLLMSVAVNIAILAYNRALDLYQYLNENTVKYFLDTYIF